VPASQQRFSHDNFFNQNKIKTLKNSIAKLILNGNNIEEYESLYDHTFATIFFVFTGTSFMLKT
jgi:hypothetical protein